MRFHQARLARLMLFGPLIGGLGCHGEGVTTRPTDTAKSSRPAAGAAMCDGREGCRVLQTREVHTRPGDALQVIQLGFRRPTDAGDDVVRCDRREYWLVRPAGKKLLAIDCEQQWGADNPGPAETTVEDHRMTFRYLEHGSNDTCDTYTATVDLLSFRIETEQRLTGEAAGPGCVNMRPLHMPITPGDGAANRPLVTLHSEGLPIQE